jgi:hypothetical protein
VSAAALVGLIVFLVVGGLAAWFGRPRTAR